ncbi:MAG: response regulator [Alphaproteobacteria bacterium]
MEQNTAEAIKALPDQVKILVVEDNKFNQLLAKKLLGQMGVQPVIANDGLEAVNLFQSQSFDIVLMDLQMPNMDGIAATREIRAMPGIVQPKIIAVTANNFDNDMDICFEVGMNDFLGKPISGAALNKKLLQYC